MAKSTKLINKTATFSWLVAVLGSMGLFLSAPLPVLADSSQTSASGTTAGSPAASGTTAGSPMTLTNPLCPAANPNCVTLNALIGRFVAAFIGMVGALALLVFVYAGIMYMTAGSSDRVKQARDTMKYAVIGLALIIFAYALTSFFFNALSSSPPGATPPKKATTLPKS